MSMHNFKVYCEAIHLLGISIDSPITGLGVSALSSLSRKLYPGETFAQKYLYLQLLPDYFKPY
jgi:hypothetical protein